MIKVEHLKKAYPNVTPLADVSFEIQKGDVVSIIGPSGTGKSTLLRCLNHLEKPTAGRIWLDGEEITASKYDITKARRKMGMVFQSFNLFANKSIAENIMEAPIRLGGAGRQEAYDQAMTLLKTVGLADKARSFPDELSGGQKQRAAIARAIAMHPEILLFDEPTSALDPAMVGEVLSVIRSLADTGMTMMIVTHEMEFARRVCNRVFYMDEGGVYEDGTPEQIFSAPRREKTRAFIYRVKNLHMEIEAGKADFAQLSAQIEAFAVHSRIPSKLRYKGELLFEELVVQGILARGGVQDGVFVDFDYSEVKNMLSLRIRWKGEAYNPLEGADELSARLICHVGAQCEYTPENGENYVKCRV